jgi:hypothetical protein
MIKYIKIFLVTILVFLILDFFFGKFFLISIEKNKIKILENKISPYETNIHFHHNLKKSFNGKLHYNIFSSKVCTNIFSMRINCELFNKDSNKFYDFIFIGDSFTEGVGVEYENTFVGILENKYKNVKIGNLSVTSYSPSLYYLKVKKYLEDGFKFKELFVFIDISDIQDEAINPYYMNVVKNDREFTTEETLNKNIRGEEKPRLNSEKKIKNVIKVNFPIAYQIAYTIKYFNLPKPTYRYVPSYQRSVWTYNEQMANYNVDSGINNSIYAMNLMHELLKTNNIKLNLVVYPHPNQLLYDKKDSLQVKIWKDFCYNKCNLFINYFDYLFENKQNLNLQEAKKIIKSIYLKGDMHLSSEGHLFFSKILLNKIKY